MLLQLSIDHIPLELHFREKEKTEEEHTQRGRERTDEDSS